MKRYLILILFCFEANAQALGMPTLSDIKTLFDDNSSEKKIAPKKYNFISKSSKKREPEYMLFCYTSSGLEIPRYSNLGIVAWQGKFLATDVETVDGRFIRIPSSSCFIESVIKK